MPDPKRTLLALWLALALAAGCARNPAPAGWLPSAGVSQQEAFGAWTEVEYAVSARLQFMRGELIAVAPDSVFLLPSGGSLVSIPRNAIRRVVVAAYNAEWGGLGAWTTLGALSTASHGGYLIISFPVWVIGGSLATGSASRAPITKFGENGQATWDDVRKYARFPGGLPDGLDRASLHAKPPPAANP